jgi:hypothetical protein
MLRLLSPKKHLLPLRQAPDVFSVSPYISIVSLAAATQIVIAAGADTPQFESLKVS